MCGHDHLKCKKCGKYTDFINAISYGSMSCNCAFIERLRHEELLEAIKSKNNQPERSKREDQSLEKLLSDNEVEFFTDENNILVGRMRCSEHDSNAVREVQ